MLFTAITNAAANNDASDDKIAGTTLQTYSYYGYCCDENIILQNPLDISSSTTMEVSNELRTYPI